MGGEREMKTILAILFCLTLWPADAMAILELRGTYGLQVVNPDDLAAGYPEITQLTGYGADAIISLPLIPFIFGLRYEMLGLEEDNSNALVEVDIDRLSVLGGLRIIDTLVYLGAIGTVGVNHTGTQLVEQKNPTIELLNEDVDIDFSFTLGVEGGVKLGGLLLGAEMGYVSMKVKNSENDEELDLTGSYLKGHLGFSF